MIDELTLATGADIVFKKGRLVIHQPTIKEIGLIGENNFFLGIQLLRLSKENLFGIIGKLDNNELKQLVYEVLSPVGLNTMVTTKEIDFMIKKESELLGYAINKVLHKKYR